MAAIRCTDANWAGANDIEARSALQTLVVSRSSLISRAHASRHWLLAERMSYLDIAANTFDGCIGESRIRAPTAAKIAFPMASATTVVPDSPSPPGTSPLLY